ncbi:hypothetical protein [Brevundimonas sp. GCM10030266]|uniref:hypothetical protein n=1 Tax=Brevundimonas sp. GCM10030266 TaxID=3273386 RepID=UPI00361A58F2
MVAPFEVPCPTSRPGIRPGRPGAAANRACAIEFLVNQRRDSLTAFERRGADPVGVWSGLLAGSDMLRNFYLARGEGGQFVHDRGAELAGVGGTGAALSTASSAGTVAAWGYVALASLLVVNFTASKPRGDLYQAGHLGVGFIENRYMVLMNRGAALRAASDPNGPCALSQGREGGLGKVLDQLGKVEAWPDAADRAAFLPVLRRISEVCTQITIGERRIAELAGRLETLDNTWPAAYADDLLALDARVERADVLLRPTPGTALTGAASGTLRALDSLISGQNSQEAVNRVRTNALLDSMTVSLTPIRVGAPPPPVESGVVLTPELMARVSHVGRAANVRPSDAEVRQVIDWIRISLPAIEDARIRYNERAYLAADLHEAASRSLLQFDYNVDTGVASVGLRAPPPAPAVAPVVAALSEPQVQPPLTTPK